MTAFLSKDFEQAIAKVEPKKKAIPVKPNKEEPIPGGVDTKQPAPKPKKAGQPSYN